MAEYRSLKTMLWRDKKFKNWSGKTGRDTKLLALYFMLNEHIPPSGIYEVDHDIVKVAVSMPNSLYGHCFKVLKEDGFLQFDEKLSLVWIINYYRHFPGKNPSVEHSVIEQLAYLPQCAIKKEFMGKYGFSITPSVHPVPEDKQPVGGVSKVRLGKERKGKVSGAAPDPVVRDLFNYWDEAFKKATGEKYLFRGGKEGTLFKQLSKLYGKEKCINLIDLFFKSAEEDPNCWWKDKLEVGVFYSQVTKLITKITKGY